MTFDFLNKFATIHAKYASNEYPNPIAMLARITTSQLAQIDLLSSFAFYGGQLLKEFDYDFEDAKWIVDWLRENIDKKDIQNLVYHLSDYKRAFIGLVEIVKYKGL